MSFLLTFYDRSGSKEKTSDRHVMNSNLNGTRAHKTLLGIPKILEFCKAIKLEPVNVFFRLFTLQSKVEIQIIQLVKI